MAHLGSKRLLAKKDVAMPSYAKELQANFKVPAFIFMERNSDTEDVLGPK